MLLTDRDKMLLRGALACVDVAFYRAQLEHAMGICDAAPSQQNRDDAIALIDRIMAELHPSPGRVIVDFDRGVVLMDDAEYTLSLQRSLCQLIHLAKEHGLNDDVGVNQAKELIRCRVLECGRAGACNGQGNEQFPCPLRKAAP